MAKYLLWLLLLVASLLHSGYVDCCIEEEWRALLEIKAYMDPYTNSDLTSYTMPWFSRTSDGRNSSSDCCQWDVVGCNVSTGRVTNLNLTSVVARNDLDAIENPWIFNVTLFHPFRDLVSLDLSYNDINGFNIPELANCRELQILDLSHNDLNNTIRGLCELTNLQQLNLQRNSFYESLPSCIGNLSSLEILDLSYNQLTGKLPSTLSNLTSLNKLDLSYNYFEGKWSLNSLANHSMLRVLGLSGNMLEVQTEESTWLPTLQLQSLQLKGCNLNKPDGTIPKFLLHQYKLSGIDLSCNNLVGSFPNWLLSNNSQLKSLFLANNSLAGRLQLFQHGNFSLNKLDISRNNFQGKVPENIGSILSELLYLNMSGNHFKGHIPNSLGNLRELVILDLSDNNFSGEIPRRIFSHCNILDTLQLSNNNLHGEMIPEDMNLPNLSWLKLSNNHLGGTIKNVLQKSTKLYYLDVSYNKVTGELPQWIGNFSELYTLLVSGNNLQGHIPREICKLELNHLDLSHNKFTGLIPPCSNYSYLEYMHLQGNRLTGKIPSVLSSWSGLRTLDLKNNQLSGSIPYWINKLSDLSILLLAGNNLHGQIPHHLCQLKKINILDLSHNNLSGKIPTCFGNMSFGINYDDDYYATPYWETYRSDDDDDLVIIYTQLGKSDEVEFLQKNRYLDYTGGVLMLMSGLDLSCNKLTGVIPSELGHLRKLRSLNLSHNHLIGSIPSSFSRLNQIESIDLSCNSLSGMIPPQLVDLNFLAIFNVSYNNLTGRVPDAAQFASFDESSYFGNPGLYGFSNSQLHNRTALAPTSSVGGDQDGNSEEAYKVDFLWSFGMSCAIMFLATIAILCLNPQWRQAWFDFVDWHLLWWMSGLLFSL